MRCIQSIYPVPLWAYPFQSSASKYIQEPITPVFQQLICFSSFIVFLLQIGLRPLDLYASQPLQSQRAPKTITI